jgi:archaellum component FlaC
MSTQEIQIVNENKTENKSEDLKKSEIKAPTIPSKYSILTGLLTSSYNFSGFTKTLDSILGLLSIGQIGFGLITWFTGDKITSIGYISGGIFSGTTLHTVRKMRLQASMQESVNVLQEENEELKESNEELKENIDDLESVSNKLSEDLKLLKETIGLLDENADDIIDNLREIYENIKKENEIHSKLNKNMIYIHILQIIKHYDTNSNFSLKLEDLQKAKKTLLNAFPNLDYNFLVKKINESNASNKITAKMIFDSIKVKN